MTTTAQNKEQAILEAAEQEFLTKGFAGARTISIAKAAGVTHAMLHYYFRTKEHLFERILDQKMHLMGASVLTAFGQPGLPLLTRLRDGIESHFDFVAMNPDMPRFIINEVCSCPDRYEMMRVHIREIAKPLISDFQQDIDAASARGDMEHIDARMLMLDIISLNIFSFIAYPLIEPILGDLTSNRECFFKLRKEENVKIIISRLKK